MLPFRPLDNNPQSQLAFAENSPAETLCLEAPPTWPVILWLAHVAVATVVARSLVVTSCVPKNGAKELGPCGRALSQEYA